MHPSLTAALKDARGVVSRRELPGLASQIDWAIRRGELVRVLNGVYALPGDAATLPIRARAVCLADPDAVVYGHAAAVLHGWLPGNDCRSMEAASARLRPTQWLVVRRRSIPRAYTRRVDGVRFTSRALTAVDLIPEFGPGVVDEALRRRVRLDELWSALAASPNRPGNAKRREVLTDSRDRPWSPAERAAHQALRAAGIRGWRANHPVIAAPEDPPIAALDIALVHLLLAIEVDGAKHHDRPDAFVHDRLRDERLALLGWQVVRFPARRVLTDPEGFAAAVAGIIHVRERLIAKRRGPSFGLVAAAAAVPDRSTPVDHVTGHQ